MNIKIESTRYSRYPKSIGNHTDKEFYWGRHKFFLDKETNTGNGIYRLWKITEAGNTVLVKDYFNDGKSWQKTIKDVEEFLMKQYPFNIEDLKFGQQWIFPKKGFELSGYVGAVTQETVTLDLGTPEKSHLEEITFGALITNWTPKYPRVLYKELNGLLGMMD
jgi:hypothetical protein